jgi:PRTRC genetic system protein A
MNRKDLILQNHFPTIMVPKYEEIIPCETGKTRLIMGHDGLYIETNQIWGCLVKKLWHSDRQLPYGIVEEVDTFKDIVNSIWPIMHEEVIPHAAEYAAKKIEWAGQIIYTPEGLRYLPLDFSSNEVKAHYELPRLSEGEQFVIDIHSHHEMPPSFSETDDQDDSGGVKIRMVLGNYRRIAEANTHFFQWKCRYTVEGFFFDWRAYGSEN